MYDEKTVVMPNKTSANSADGAAVRFSLWVEYAARPHPRSSSHHERHWNCRVSQRGDRGSAMDRRGRAKRGWGRSLKVGGRPLVIRRVAAFLIDILILFVVLAPNRSTPIEKSYSTWKAACVSRCSQRAICSGE